MFHRNLMLVNCVMIITLGQVRKTLSFCIDCIFKAGERVTGERVTGERVTGERVTVSFFSSNALNGVRVFTRIYLLYCLSTSTL